MQPVLAGFEDYLPLLIFFTIWWISSKRKRAVRQQPPAPPSKATPKSGKVPTIQEILRQVLVGEVELPKGMEPGSRPQRPTPPADSGYVDLPDFEEETEEPPVVRKKPSRARQETAMPVPVAMKQQAVQRSRPVTCKPFMEGGICRRELRKAVVWSEILGPPVGLRDR